jgi:hypothetical protein
MLSHSNDVFRGICQGVLADGELNTGEADFLLNYLDSLPDSTTNKYPFSVLKTRLIDSLKDGILDDDEVSDLLGILLDIINGASVSTLSTNSHYTVDLKWHFDDIPIEFFNKTFVITGVFEKLNRKEIEKVINDQGGIINKKNVTRSTDFLLVGGVVSAGWRSGNYGRKIEDAINIRGQGQKLKIISETHWLGLIK